jgi:methyl-accepting chemotaxis protein
MSIENNTQKATAAVEKVISDQSSRLETAMGELNKLQSKGLEQVNALIESVSRSAKEQIAFAEQIGGEWRKLMLAATRNTTELFAPKA